MRNSLVAVCAAVALLPVTPAFAQGEGGPDMTKIKVRLGPLMMNPTISLDNIGIDHNVFNDPPDKIPKQDFTLTVTPLSDFWLHLGPTWVTASLNSQINWYQKYASERTANNQYKLGWSVPGSLMSFKIIYPQSDVQKTFWLRPINFGFFHFEPGWMTVYLLAYLPAMFALRAVLRVA